MPRVCSHRAMAQSSRSAFAVSAIDAVDIVTCARTLLQSEESEQLVVVESPGAHVPLEFGPASERGQFSSVSARGQFSSRVPEVEVLSARPTSEDTDRQGSVASGIFGRLLAVVYSPEDDADSPAKALSQRAAFSTDPGQHVESERLEPRSNVFGTNPEKHVPSERNSERIIVTDRNRHIPTERCIAPGAASQATDGREFSRERPFSSPFCSCESHAFRFDLSFSACSGLSSCAGLCSSCRRQASALNGAMQKGAPMVAV